MKHNRKGNVSGLFYAAAAAAVAFVVTGLVITYGAKVNTDVQAGISNTSLAYASAGNVTTGLGTFATSLPTMASVGIAVLIIGLLVYGFSGLFNKGGEL